VGVTIVRLHFFDGLSLREIAERLDLSYDQVRHRYQTTLRSLEQELGPQP
jgi:DNA-directed RNA polymerase specialized sigma24 family protein